MNWKIVVILALFSVAICCFGVQQQQIDFIMSGLHDPNGNPLSGGKIYSYSAGTTASKTLYTNALGTSAETNPVILDAYGRKAVFGSGKYKFVVTTSDGTSLFTVDGLEYRSLSDFASSPVNPHGSILYQTNLIASDVTTRSASCTILYVASYAYLLDFSGRNGTMATLTLDYAVATDACIRYLHMTPGTGSADFSYHPVYGVATPATDSSPIPLVYFNQQISSFTSFLASYTDIIASAFAGLASSIPTLGSSTDISVSFSSNYIASCTMWWLSTETATNKSFTDYPITVPSGQKWVVTLSGAVQNYNGTDLQVVEPWEIGYSDGSGNYYFYGQAVQLDDSNNNGCGFTAQFTLPAGTWYFAAKSPSNMDGNAGLCRLLSWGLLKFKE